MTELSATMKTISIVSGCYNEEENVEDLYSQLCGVISTYPQYQFEIILIDNCSRDKTVEILRGIAATDKRLKVIVNARNFGAIRSGYYALLQATGDAVIALASDLQDPPSLLPQFIAKWEEGAKIVLAIKNESEEPGFFYFVRSSYYALVKRLSDVELNAHSTGFGLYDRKVMDALRKIDDPYPYFRGLISDIGFESAKIYFTQPARKRGFTSNNLYTLYDLAMLGITNHSKVPLRLATFAGFLMSLVSLFVAIGYLVYKLLFWSSFPMGMAPVIIGMFLLSSVQLFFIGILGEYIGAIHTQVLHRPLVVEKERINFES